MLDSNARRSAPALHTDARRQRPTPYAIGLDAYSFGYLCGFTGAGTPRACPRPLDAYALMDLAARHGLAGVEFPPARCLRTLEPAELQKARAYADERNLFIVVDAGIVDRAELEALLPVAAALGAKTVRTVASSILCGDRRAVRDSWPAYLAEIALRLRAVRGLAEQIGVSIAVENHQDLTSSELVMLCDEVGSAQVGVNLDAVNPLAVGEDPLDFAQRIMPYLKNVHLKDYTLYKTPQGFRLVRCAIGDGVLDVPALLALCTRRRPRLRSPSSWVPCRHAISGCSRTISGRATRRGASRRCCRCCACARSRRARPMRTGARRGSATRTRRHWPPTRWASSSRAWSICAQ